MASYFRATVQQFLATSQSELLGTLTRAYSQDGFAEMKTDTARTWWDDLESLRDALSRVCDDRPTANQWGILLEFSVPRKQSRLDVVLLIEGVIVVLECKSAFATREAFRQVETYALLLHYFHKPSDRRRILPIVVSSRSVSGTDVEAEMLEARQGELEFEVLPSFWIARTQIASWAVLPRLLLGIDVGGAESMDEAEWDDGAYFPTPTIIEAALALKTGLNIREIAHSEAAEHEVSAVVDEIRAIVADAKASHKHVICFVTGVPGSGKTLVGLSLAHLSEDREDAIHFMSGNGPLVAVLQELFRRQAMKDGAPAAQAKVHAETLIENVHVFAKLYTERDRDRAPSNHVIIFDEAQRAWNLAQNLAKFKRDYSEPEMLLKIMQRHEDWSCVIALVGGGQEINSGEAGLEEWGKAIVGSGVEWSVYASPEVLTGGPSTAGQRLFGHETNAAHVETKNTLHLRTSNRSLRADKLASWVNHVLAGDATRAAELKIADRFPLYMSRDLSQVRETLAKESLGDSRFGLVGSSGAARLRAEGLEPSSTFHADYPWHHWYLSPRSDVRSSYQCEVFATEFEVQGLELDWIGLCWGGDYVWGGSSWIPRDLRPGPVSKWGTVKNAERQRFRRNAYRVLLTRARQGMVIYVPRGSEKDSTRDPASMDATAAFLQTCGVKTLPKRS
jgi:hypothetical protein